MNYMEEVQKAADKLQGYFKDTDGWKVTKQTKDGISIFWKASTEFEGYLYKGEAIINAPPKTVFEYVDPQPDGKRTTWDSNMKKVELLKPLEMPNLRINRAYTASACMGLISPRDFVDVVLTKETDTYISTNGVSIQYDNCPEDKKFVRGWNYPCGMVCCHIPGEPKKTKLVTLIQPDIKGMLPRTLVDQAIPGSMVEFFQELKEVLKKDGKLSS